MVEKLENLLECKEHLRDKIQLLIDIFTSFYGEEKRDEISKKFSSALLIAYTKPETLGLIISKLSSEHTKDIFQKHFKGHPVLTEKDLLNNVDLNYHAITPIYKYHEFFELYKLGEEGRKQKYIEDSYNTLKKNLPELTLEEFKEMIKTKKLLDKYSHIRSWLKGNIMYYTDLSNAEKDYKYNYEATKDLLHKIDPSITLDNFGECLEQEGIKSLNDIADQMPSILSEYNERMSKYDKYIKQRDFNQKLKDDLTRKYYIMLIEENKDLLSEEDIAGLEKCKAHPEDQSSITNYTRYLIGQSITTQSPLESFSEESQKILDSDSELSWKKDLIIKDRINFFKRHDIDLGDDYEAYVRSEEAQAIWPSTDRVAQFIGSKNKIVNDFNIEYYTSIPEYQETLQEIETRNLLDRDYSFNPSLFTSKSHTMVNPNLIQTANGYELSPLVLILCNHLDKGIDHNIIHELNHLYELSLSSVEDDTYTVICGWDAMTCEMRQYEVEKVDTINTDRERRDYELFNEIVNELIAQEISEELEKRHECIFNSEEEREFKHTTSYEETFFIVREFYEQYKKEIIESRSEGNIQVIWDAVGKENFDELNELFHEFRKHFNGFKIYSLYNSLRNNEDTEQTRIYHEIEDKRDEILRKMKSHYETREEGKTK